MKDMIQQHIYEWMKHPERLDRETLYELRSLLARYPYFQTARLLYLKNLFLLHDISFGEELRRSALYITDRRILFSLIEGERYSVKSLEKQQKVDDQGGLDRTLSLIDAFLSSMPEEQAPEIISIPVDAASDYSSYLMHQPVESETQPSLVPKLKGQDLIDNFLEKSEEEPLIASVGKVEPEVQSSETEESDEDETVVISEDLEDESYFTETLAKIYVKQQRYSKALEIIQRLNLNYPKKSAYFADQIRFLEKLIINTKSK